MHPQYPNLPFVGQLLDYYLNQTTRLAAIVTEVHPNSDISARPKINLLVLNPDASTDQYENVEPVDETEAKVDPQSITLTDRWGFQHEFYLSTDESHNDENTVPKGTQSNEHVGLVEVRY